MTKRERIICALKHQETDFVPYFVDFTMLELQKCIEYTGDENLYWNTGTHMLGCGLGEMKEVPDKKDHFMDSFGVVWDKIKDKDIGCIVGSVIEDIENYTYEFPTLNEKQLRKNIEDLISAAPEHFKFFNIGFSMFERAWTLLGMENLLISMIANPEEVKNLMQKITDYNLKSLKIACEYKELDAMMFGDDWGQQKGLIMGAPHWRELVKPYVSQMYAYAKSKGKFVLQHSCGDIREILDDLIEIGLDAYQTFQPEIYGLTEAKEKWGNKLTFWGGISTQHILPHGTAEEVKQITIDTINIMKKGGGYIAAPTHSLPHDIPVENVLAMIDVFKNQQKYCK